MVLFNIFYYFDKWLYKVVKFVDKVDDWICKFVVDMVEIMYVVFGIGLVVMQVDVYECVIVIDVFEEKNELCVFINLEIVWLSDVKQIYEEGCLLVFGIYDEVECFDYVCVCVFNEQGEMFEFDCEGLFVVCVQYEMDYLMGCVFVEYLLLFKQMCIKMKMKKFECVM